MTTAAVLDALKAAGFDDAQIKTDTDSLKHWGLDWTRHFEPNPSAIIFPKSTEQVQKIVQLCNEHKVVITPSGGRTGLSAGAVAKNGEIVVSLDKMNQVLKFYPNDRMVSVQAGMITESLQDYAESVGLYYPVDFASAGSSQIGGNINTNAGGIKVIRYGMTRNWVLGLTVVTGKGDVLKLNNGMMKNATGYDFRHLFIGSEGTLGIVTEAMIKLERPPINLTAMVLGVDEFPHIMTILAKFRNKLDLTAFELFDKTALEKVLKAGHTVAPFESRTNYYALLEFEATTEEIMETALSVFEGCSEEGLIVDGVMSQSLEQLGNLWKLRETIAETLAAYTPYKNDISVLIDYVPDFIAGIGAVVGEHYPDFETVWYGHIGDGNLHLNILKPDNLTKDEFFEKCQVVNKLVFETVQKFGGSISAEHGVGMTKKPYLEYTRTATEIEYMRAIKAVFDPNGVMNVGKIFD